jgi:D-glycero-D-manno-heptose 1,7-bisphosphate phosphatase
VINKKPYILLDRDGTVIKHVHHLVSVEEIELADGAIEALSLLQNLDFRLGVITNQSVIGLRLATAEQVDNINKEILTQLNTNSIEIDFFLVCPHTKDDSCNCRKPKSGLSHLASNLGVNLAESFMVGDSVSDVQFGINSGVKASFHITKSYCGESVCGIHVKDILAAALYISRLVSSELSFD